MIPTYNCATFLAETLQGVLAQDAGPDAMQIEVVDDCSDDLVENIVTRIGGPRVGFYRHSARVGHIANFQTCLVRSRGEIVHILHGDDIVRPGFYKALEKGFEASPETGAAFCRSAYIDASGRVLSEMSEEQPSAGFLTNAVARLASEQCIMTPSIAVRRSMYEQLGGFDKRLKCSEDWEMWVRIAAASRVWYEPQVMASYRMHSNSNTARHMRSAEDMAYTHLAIDLFSTHVPSEIRTQVVRRAKGTYALTSLENARRMFERGELRGCVAHLREAFRLQPSLRTAARIAKLLLTRTNGYA